MLGLDSIQWAVIIGGIGQTGYVLLYALAPWWRDVVGRALFVKGLALALILDVGVASFYVTIPRWVFVTLYWFIAAAVWQQFATLVAQRRNRRRRSRAQ